MSSLPNTWTWTTCGQLTISMKNGIYKARESYATNGTACLRMYNIEGGSIVWKDIKRMLLSHDEIEEYCLRPGDILVNRVNSRELVGKAAVIPFGLEPCVFESKNIRLRVDIDLMSPRYLNYCLLEAGALYFSKNAQQTVGMASINQAQLAAFPIPLAPRHEQHRIVAEIEKQFTRLDAGVAALERARANLKRYRASVLKAACEGRLVPTEAELARAEGRNYEPADRLLARILKERRAKWEADQLAKLQAQGKALKDNKWKEKYQEPVGPDTADLPELPEGWVWTTVDAMLAEPLCNGISIKGRDTPPGVAALKLNAMSERGFKYKFVRYLPIDQKLAKELEVVAGDFFVSRGNGSLDLVGRGTLAQDPPFQVVFPDTMIRLQLLGIVKSTAWVPTIWSAKFIRRQIEQRVKTTAGIWKIAQPEVASIVLPLPPLAEQSRIVAEVARRLSVIDELEALIATNLKRAERLRQSILKRAFEGKLVPQDPNDEPASVLLERIRAERQVELKATAKAISKPSQKSKRPQVAETQAELFR